MRANPTLIGAFVIGAFLLGVGAVLLFGSGEAFAPKERYILYFRDSVDGLVPGSPVKMSGVRVGEVEEVLIEYVEEKDEFRTPVTIVVFTEKFAGIDVDKRGPRDELALVNRMIQRGHRATLVSESLITGRLGIAFGVHPDTEAVFMGGDDLPYPELPTATTGLRALMKEVEGIPVEELFSDLRTAIQSIDARVGSDEITETIAAVKTAFDEFGDLGRQLNAKVGPAIDSITKVGESADLTLAEARGAIRNLDEKFATVSAQLSETLASIEKLSDDVDVEVAPTAQDVRKSLKAAEGTFDGIRTAADELTAFLGRDSAAVKELRKALVEIASAARALKNLADTLQRQPESLLQGKRGGK